MNDPIRSKIETTKEFIKKHQTLVACTATAAVTVYMSRDRDITRLKAITARLLLSEDQNFALLLDATSFIDHKEMTEEFYAWAPRLIRD